MKDTKCSQGDSKTDRLGTSQEEPRETVDHIGAGAQCLGIVAPDEGNGLNQDDHQPHRGHQVGAFGGGYAVEAPMVDDFTKR